MAPAQSKIAGQLPLTTELMNAFYHSMIKNQSGRIMSMTAVAIVLYLIKIRVEFIGRGGSSKQGGSKDKQQKQDQPKRKGRGDVDKVFWQRILKLLKIVLPTWRSEATVYFIVLTFGLVARTYLSIWISDVNSQIVKSIIQLKMQNFIKRLIQLMIFALPASFVNSGLEYLNKKLSHYFRQKLTDHFNKEYVQGMTYYQVKNLDSRISNPDQLMTDDIDKWANSLSQIYSNFTKPMLDIILFSQKLAGLVGYTGPLMVILWYFFSGIFIKFVSPAFGHLTAVSQAMEGDYRRAHSDIVQHSEEIGFYKGNNWERIRLENNFNKLIKHSEYTNKNKLFQGSIDGMLTKYGAVLMGYAILGMPVFGSESQAYLNQVNADPSLITRDYVRNSSLLINLAKAIGRIVISYKEIQQLAGFTTGISQMQEVLSDLQKGIYRREMTKDAEKFPFYKQNTQSIVPINHNNIETTEDFIQFDKIPIFAPNGDLLIEAVDIMIEKGMNVIVTGPNGCGKSSLFRILGGLWPIFEGKLRRPDFNKIFYIPQKPYLPPGTLRDQVIYPDNQQQQIEKFVAQNPQIETRDPVELQALADQDILETLRILGIHYLVEGREEHRVGWEAVKVWKDVFSGGEKQRIAIARLFYHRPEFAIMDECTSAVSKEHEPIIYATGRKLGIALFTVSHRPEDLAQYHDYILRINEKKQWDFKKIAK